MHMEPLLGGMRNFCEIFPRGHSLKNTPPAPLGTPHHRSLCMDLDANATPCASPTQATPPYLARLWCDAEVAPLVSLTHYNYSPFVYYICNSQRCQPRLHPAIHTHLTSAPSVWWWSITPLLIHLWCVPFGDRATHATHQATEGVLTLRVSIPRTHYIRHL
jgi:hypothetical protein